MTISVATSLNQLQQTPLVLDALLSQAGDALLYARESAEGWTPFEIVAHLLACEQFNFMPRINQVLSGTHAAVFQPFDMGIQREISTGRSIQELLDQFLHHRAKNMEQLRRYTLDEQQLAEHGSHPTLGTVTLAQVFSTWIAHDLAHIGQVVRIMARQYKEDVGPFKTYLRILQ